MNILYTVYREPAHQTAHIVQRFLYVKGPQYKRQKILNQTNETEETKQTKRCKTDKRHKKILQSNNRYKIEELQF